MKLRELEAQAEFLAPVIAAAVAKAVAPLKEQIAQRDDRIADLTKRLDELPAPVEPDLEAISKLVQIPEVKDGRDAEVDLDALAKAAAALVVLPEVQDGKDAEVDLDALAKAAAALVVVPEPVVPSVEDIVARIPVPKDGADANMPELKLHLTELVKSIEIPKAQPAPTVDEVAATFERRFSDLTLSWERQARDTFEKAADRMPKPENGRDAIPLEGFDLTLADDGRTLTVKMQAGETVIEKSVKIAAVLDRGIFKHEGTYEKGDGVSYGGSFWIAKCDNPQGVPGSGETDWRCSVKAGRPGRDLRENASTFDASKGVKLP